jgi:hypothetical protein
MGERKREGVSVEGDRKWAREGPSLPLGPRVLDEWTDAKGLAALAWVNTVNRLRRRVGVDSLRLAIRTELRPHAPLSSLGTRSRRLGWGDTPLFEHPAPMGDIPFSSVKM